MPFRCCRWYVDDSVIRVHYNKGGVPYPTWRPMAVEASLWNGSSWATQGGTKQLDISHQPFLLQYEGFDGVDGCVVCPTNKWSDPSPDCPMSPSNPALAACKSGNWWNTQSVLSNTQIAQLKAHEQNYVIYNYCYDYNRFGGASKIPPECANNEYT